MKRIIVEVEDAQQEENIRTYLALLQGVKVMEEDQEAMPNALLQRLEDARYAYSKGEYYSEDAFYKKLGE